MTRPSSRSGTRMRQSGEKPKILVIDDSEIATKHLAKTLDDAGFSVVTRTTGVGAQAVILRERPALVILDRSMPLVKGDDLVRTMRAHPTLRKTIVLLCSGDHAEELARAASACGANGWVSKADLTQLVKTVVHWLAAVRPPQDRLVAACGTTRGTELVELARAATGLSAVESGSEVLRRMTSRNAPDVVLLGTGLTDLAPERVLKSAIGFDASWARRVIVLVESKREMDWAAECEQVDVEEGLGPLLRAIERVDPTAADQAQTQSG
jgi:CheY-like chemotaxis protein